MYRKTLRAGAVQCKKKKKKKKEKGQGLKGKENNKNWIRAQRWVSVRGKGFMKINKLGAAIRWQKMGKGMEELSGRPDLEWLAQI